MTRRVLKARTDDEQQGVRPPSEAVQETVRRVIDDIRRRGDAAVREHSKQFDNWEPEEFRLSEARIAEVVASLPDTVLDPLSGIRGVPTPRPPQMRYPAQGLSSLAEPTARQPKVWVFIRGQCELH